MKLTSSMLSVDRTWF